MERLGLSARAVEREYGISRDRICKAIADGELPAFRLGAQRLLILRTELERWLERYRVAPSPHAERVVGQVLERFGLRS